MKSAIPPHFIEVSPGHWTHPSNIQGAPQSHAKALQSDSVLVEVTKLHKPRLNKTEARWKMQLEARGLDGRVMEQAITLRLDPPFKSYTADLAYTDNHQLVLVEVKGPHRFREKGIAKAALAAKTYPEIRFELADWTGKEWKESVL